MCHFFGHCRNLRFSTPFLPFPYTWSTFAYFIIFPIDKLPGGCRSRSPERGYHGHGRDGLYAYQYKNTFFQENAAVREGAAAFLSSTHFRLKPVHNLKYYIILEKSASALKRVRFFAVGKRLFLSFCHARAPPLRP